MDRRHFLVSLLLVASVLLVHRPMAAAPQDVEYLQALDRAQRDRPKTLTMAARIAPVGEPGTPLVIHGKLLRADGTTPARDAIVFAYHTDAKGVYNVPAAAPHSWRLRGWAKTGADGRFEFTTIRPAPYPDSKIAAHVHFSIEGPGIPRESAELLFQGDPLLSAAERDASAKAGRFGSVRPGKKLDGVEHVMFEIRLSSSGRSSWP